MIALSNNRQIVERYSYDVFGEPNRISDVNNPYMFTGREYDEEAGNYYYRARYYNPHIGRFLQADPIGYDDGLNLYTYCGNDPVNWIDPWGELKRDWIFHPWVAKDVKNALDKKLKGKGGNLKKGDTKRAGQAIADEMTNKELDKIRDADKGTQEKKIREITKRIEDKLKGGKGDPETEKEREKDDPGYKPQEGDKDVIKRIKDALDEADEEQDDKGQDKNCPKGK